MTSILSDPPSFNVFSHISGYISVSRNILAWTSFSDFHTTPKEITVTSGIFLTLRQLIIYTIEQCANFNRRDILSCTLDVLLRYKNYSQQDTHIGRDHKWMATAHQICGTFTFILLREHPLRPEVDQFNLQLIIYIPRYNIFISFLKMAIVYSSGCFEQGVLVINHSNNTTLSQFCGDYDTFDMIYPVNILNIHLYSISMSTSLHLRIRYQPTHRLPNIPLNTIMRSDNHHIFYERNWLVNNVIFWIKVAFYKIIRLVKEGTTGNATIYDGPLTNCPILRMALSSSFQILLRSSLYHGAVNFTYESTAAPEHLIPDNLQVLTGSVPIYRMYKAPAGFKLHHVTISGSSGEACSLGGVVFLAFDSNVEWDTIGPYCDTSLWNVTMKNKFMSGIVIYSYGAVNIKLYLTILLEENGQFLVHMGPGNLPFIAEIDGYYMAENTKVLSILPKPWNHGNSETSFLLLYYTPKGFDYVDSYHRASLRRLITIATHADAGEVLRRSNCDWWIETRDSDVTVKGYLSEYLELGKFELLTENAVIKWNQGCSMFPYSITVSITAMVNKISHVFVQPRNNIREILLTNDNKRYTLQFPALRMNHAHHIRVVAQCKFGQIWEVVQNDCKFARVTFGQDVGWQIQLTLDATKPQKLPSGYNNMTLLTIWNESPEDGNFTQDSCNLTLHATTYIRLPFRTDIYEVTVDEAQVSPFIYPSVTRWCHEIETFSALLALCEGIHRSPVLKQTIEQTIEIPVIWDSIALIISTLSWTIWTTYTHFWLPK